MSARSLPLSVAALGVAAALGACRSPAPEAPTAPRSIAATPATVETLCADSPRGWGVLDERGAIAAETLGACLGRVEHPVDGPLWQFRAQYRVRGDERPRWELYTWLDGEGRPRYAEHRTPLVVTHFAWREGQLVVRRLGDSLSIDAGEGLWVTPDHGLYIRELMLRLGVGRADQGVVWRGFVPDSERISELDIELERDLDDPARAEARVAGSALAFGLTGADAGALGELRIEHLEHDGTPRYWALDEVALGPALPAQPAPRYRLPEGLALDPIEIPGSSGRPTLAGEIVKLADPSPGADTNADAAPARVPGVLFIAGAGPQDRRGFVPDSGVDLGSHELHDALAASGYAVMRIDDRGVGHSTLGDDPTPGFSALVDDARRALLALASQPFVDPDRLILIGHGEGALIASILAAERPRVAGRRRQIAALIVLAGPGRNLRELVYDEIRAAMLGRREGEIRTAVDRAKRVHDAALAGEDLPATSEGAREWMIEAFAEDPLARLAEVRAPILAVQGGKDFQVSPARDFGPIRELVESRAAAGSEAILFADLDHLFKPEPGLSTPGHYADLRRHLDAELIATIVTWLGSGLGQR